MTKYRILFAILLAFAVLLGCADRQIEEPPFSPLDPYDESFEADKAAREARPGTPEYRIVAEMELASVLLDKEAYANNLPIQYAYLEAALKHLKNTQSTCEEYGITYYRFQHISILRAIAILRAAFDEMTATIKTTGPKEFTETAVLIVTFRTQPKTWAPNSEMFGLEFRFGFALEGFARTLIFKSTPEATRRYYQYLQAREDVESVVIDLSPETELVNPKK